MSAAARNIMAKYGWKNGEGLGKEKEGVTSYIKVSWRDSKVSTGLGHMAEGHGCVQEAVSDELDGVFRSLKERKREQSKISKSGEGDNNLFVDSLKGSKDMKVNSSSRTQSSPISTSCSKRNESQEEDSTTDADERSPLSANETTRKLKREREEVNNTYCNRCTDRNGGDHDDDNSSSASSSGSDEEESEVKRPLTDDELFRRCGGVRLGRGGRHRCFEGKLARTAGGTSSYWKA